MTAASIIGIQRYVFYRLELAAYFENPGDGRIHPSIPARDILWAASPHFCSVRRVRSESNDW